MPRWKKDAKEWTVSVYYTKKGVKTNVPKPLVDFLGKPDRLTFALEGKKVIVKV